MTAEDDPEPTLNHVRTRVVIHFPGFEPLDAEANRMRYARSAAQSAAAWGCAIAVGSLVSSPSGPHFPVEASGKNWRTRSTIHVLDHADMLVAMRAESGFAQFRKGYFSAVWAAWNGAITAYFATAWRFALFYLFPFVTVAVAALSVVAIAGLPIALRAPAWNFFWSAPLALVFVRHVVMPAMDRLHIAHMFANWRMAAAVAALDPTVAARVDTMAAMAHEALAADADEYLITSHSMGSNLAVHTIGLLLERDPAAFAGKTVVFATLGGALLQCALLRSASILRRRAGLVARCAGISWFEVQCLTDPIHFYKSRVTSALGLADAPQPERMVVRFKNMLTPEHYRRIKRDMLRVHRQYVLGSDRRSEYDFTLMTAGPLAAGSFATYSPARLPPIADGAMLSSSADEKSLRNA